MSLSSIYILHRQNDSDQVATSLSKGAWPVGLSSLPPSWLNLLQTVQLPISSHISRDSNFSPSAEAHTLVNKSILLLSRAVVITVSWSQAQNKLTKLGSSDMLVTGCQRPIAKGLLSVFALACPCPDGSPEVGNTTWSHAVCRFCEPACS